MYSQTLMQEASGFPKFGIAWTCCDEIACYCRIPVLFHDTISFSEPCFYVFFTYRTHICSMFHTPSNKEKE